MEEIQYKEIRKIATAERLEQLEELFRRKQYIKYISERRYFVISGSYSLVPSKKKY